ncbi:MAG: sulfite exporter TauE/SafE family protein [Sulfuriflexus sp.]|nr:sulfite exporter TauE/SafE family protein [Sulfuriflexus sp.]
MEFGELISSPVFIAIIFFIIAFIYSSVGLGGGSSYTAMMAIMGFTVLAIPMISLSLNVIVTTIGSINFIRNRHAQWRLILPFLITSMPMAYLGGSLHVSKEFFYWVLLFSLCIVAARIYLWRDIKIELNLSSRGKWILSLIAGSLLGLIAGVAGIGGGIYLVPLIIVLGLGTEKQAAACGAIFIWLNSMLGLLSRWQYNPMEVDIFIYLVVAVAAGALLGSYLGAFKLSAKTMDKILGVIILVAIVALVRKLFII